MRQVVEAIDIAVYFGKSKQSSYKIIAKIREYFNKSSRQPINATEFSDYYGFEKEGILDVMKANDLLKNKTVVKSKSAATPEVEKTNSAKPTSEPYRFSREKY